MAGIQIDGVNNKIDFDDDLDTSISANTDDTLVIEAGGNTMATITATTFTINDGTTITTADNTDTLTLISTDADATQGPVLNLYRNSSAVEDDNDIARINFTGNDSGGNATIYASTRVIINDVTDGTEDTQIIHSQMIGGAFVSTLRCKPDEIVLNDSSIDLDFRVESNGHAHAFFVNGGDDNIGLFNSAPVFTTGSGMHLGDNVKLGFGSGGSGRPDFQLSADSTNLALVCGFGSDDVDININTGGKISTGGEQAPDVDSGGITLNQGGDDGNILTFKSSDVAHGVTAFAETDTWLDMRKNSDGGGGLLMRSFSETATAFRHVVVASGSSTAESSAATSYWSVDARKNADNTNVTGLAADDNLASFRHSDEAKFIIKGDGELFSDTTGTVGTFDSYEDAQLVRAYDLSHMQGVINSKFDKFVQYNKDDLQKAKLIGTDDDGNATPFVNITGMQRLHNGAIWQQYEKTERLAKAMYELAKAAVGEEKANEILEQNEIKLLN